MKSRVPSSAQWMSSRTSTSGRSSASSSKKRCQAPNASSRGSPSPLPTKRLERAQQPLAFALVVRAGGERLGEPRAGRRSRRRSRAPPTRRARCRRARRTRRRRRRAPGPAARSPRGPAAARAPGRAPTPACSCPCPGAPTSVTSWSDRSRPARSTASTRRRRSVSRPTSAASPCSCSVDALPRPRAAAPPKQATAHGLALRVDRRRLPVLDRTLGGAPRRLADEHAVHRRRRLQPRRRVHDVSRHHRLARLRARREEDERLARVHCDPHVEAFVDEGVANRERTAHRALGVVLVGGGCSVDGHHRIADELLDPAAEPLELRSARGRDTARAAPARPPGRPTPSVPCARRGRRRRR